MAGVTAPDGCGALDGAVGIWRFDYYLSSSCMIVLALDTTTVPGSCAVARDGVVVEERPGDERVSHAERLPLDLMRTLEDARVPLDRVDAFAVATGPGSFTGMRVGIAAMQGLAFAAAKPRFGLSALDALASAGGGGRIAAWIDAWRGEVYAALYDAGREIEPATVATPELLLERYPRLTTRFIGDGAAKYWDRVRDRWGAAAELAEPPAPLIAGTIARMATAAAVRGERPAADAVRPLYVRRSDAERTRDARPSG